MFLAELAKWNFQPLFHETRPEGAGAGRPRRRGVIDGSTVVKSDACGMCGRTLLTGESAETYSDPEEDGSFTVCPTCRSEARQLGYEPAG